MIHRRRSSRLCLSLYCLHFIIHPLMFTELVPVSVLGVFCGSDAFYVSLKFLGTNIKDRK